MTDKTRPSLDDYDAIASAVMETERGRWFLAEFARRNRTADTASVLAALGELERALSEKRVERQAPTADGRRAASLILRIAERVALIRNDLGPLTAGTRITRVRRRLDQLERFASLALAATGCSPEEIEAAPSPDPTEADTPAPTPLNALALAPEAAEAADLALDEPGRPQPDEAAPDVETPAEFETGPQPATVFINGHPIDILAPSEDEAPGDFMEAPDAAPAGREESEWSAEPVFRHAAPHDEPDPPAGSEQPDDPPADQKRPKLPAAWTPTLLESLSDEEKAILFA